MDTNKRAFTLIELMVAIAIFVMIILMMSKLFHQSSLAWSAGMRKAQGNMTGRGAIAYMAREIMNTAVDSSILNDSSIPANGTILQITTLANNESEGNVRCAKKVKYYLDAGTHTLKKEEYNVDLNNVYCSWDVSATSRVELATNVAKIKFTTSDSISHSTTLPEYMIIELTLNRVDDVSGVGGVSAGPDGVMNTGDDITTY